MKQKYHGFHKNIKQGSCDTENTEYTRIENSFHNIIVFIVFLIK